MIYTVRNNLSSLGIYLGVGNFLCCHLLSYSISISDIFTSCKEAMQTNPSASLHWILHVNMSNAVRVECKLESGVAYANFPHDSQASTYVSGYESSYSYQRKIKYSNNLLSDITAFVDSSASCSQYLKLTCRDSIITNVAHVRDRNGVALAYFGGGPPNGSGCACGVTGTCTSSSKKCNCDRNSRYYTDIDEGEFTDKSILPITEIRMGDTGSSSEYAYHELHQLKCLEN